jgi:outer membrane murein-binding lipoprotein Lpp
MEEQTVVKKGVSPLAIIGIAVLVAIVFGGGAYAYVNNKATKEKNDLNAQITQLQSQVASAKVSATVTSIASASATTDETANWKTYTNDKNGFSFKYLSDWTKEEDNVQSSATDVVFDLGKDNPLVVRVYYGSNDGHGGATYFSVERNAQRTYTAGVADEFLFPNGNGYGQTIPYITERFIKNGVVYAFEFNGGATLTSQDIQILNSLQFAK